MKLSLSAATQATNLSPTALLLSSFEDDLLEGALEKVIAARNLIKPHEILKLPATLLKTDPHKILEILKSSPLFGPPFLLILEKITESHLAPLENLLKSLDAGDFFILTTGYLKSSSPLRAFFEASSSLAYIPIYSPTPLEISKDIKGLFSSFGHVASEELLDHLTHRYLESSQLIVSELTPFCLLFENPSLLNLESYRNFAVHISFDETHFVESFLLQTHEILGQNPSSFSIITFLRLLNFHIIRLIEIQTRSPSGPLKFQGLSLDHKNLYEKALKIWSVPLLLKALKEIRRLEIETKNGSLQESTAMFQRLFQVYS